MRVTRIVIFRWLGTLGLSLCLMWVAGCAHVNHLRDAQEAFSRAGDAENRIAAAARDDLYRSASTGANDIGRISAGYAAALVSLDKLEQDIDAVTKLKSDGLYGNAVALRAMIYWRLQKYDKSRTEADRALKGGLEKGSRDYALMIALPGLIANDEARALIIDVKIDDKPADVPDSVFARLNSADAAYCDADKTVDANHPIRIYLAVSALAALRNVQQACDKKFSIKASSTGKASMDVGKALECFKDAGKVDRDRRAAQYRERLRALGAPDSALTAFLLGVTMNDASKDYCPRS